MARGRGSAAALRIVEDPGHLSISLNEPECRVALSLKPELVPS
jgi:hypothetical protein